MLVQILHPSLPDCETCRKYVFDENGQVVTYGGAAKKPRMRGKNERTPCDMPVGCPKGHYSDPRTLTDANELAYQHYLECCAVGFRAQEQADPIVRRNAAIIAGVEKLIRERRQKSFEEIVKVAAQARL